MRGCREKAQQRLCCQFAAEVFQKAFSAIITGTENGTIRPGHSALLAKRHHKRPKVESFVECWLNELKSIPVSC
jgi:hypothetical protein